MGDEYIDRYVGDNVPMIKYLKQKKRNDTNKIKTFFYN